MPLELLQSLDAHTDRVWTLAWNPEGTVLASSGADKTIRLWARSGDKFTCAAILTETHSKSIRRICWSPCGQFIASASFDSTVCIWKGNTDDKTWSTVVNLEGHENEVKSVAWSHDGNYLASCGRDKTVWIWERACPDSEEEDEDVASAGGWDCSDVKNDHTKDVKHIVWHPKFNILVSCSYDDTVKFFYKNDQDWTCFETLTSHTSTVWSADFSASGEFLATCSDDKTVRIWKNHAHDKLPAVESNSWKCVSVIQGYHSRTIYDVSWCKMADVIISASGDNSLALYGPSSDTGAEIFTCIDKLLHAHDCDVNCVDWNNTENGLFATGGDDYKVKLWRYNRDDKGTAPLTCIEDIIKEASLTKQVTKSGHLLTMNVTDFSTLLNLVKSMQSLQNELYQDHEKQAVEKLLGIKISSPNPQPIEICDLRLDEKINSVEGFSIRIIDDRGEIVHKFDIVVDQPRFGLMMPKRSVKLLSVADKLFLYEKTGDLFEITNSGESEFLLGHLFMFSDLKFMTSNDGENIRYVISADRDEKIRISRYPDTYIIERFCFGHQHFIRRLLLADENTFISIDTENNINLWSLDDLSEMSNDELLKPRVTTTMELSTTKRFRDDSTES